MDFHGARTMFKLIIAVTMCLGVCQLAMGHNWLVEPMAFNTNWKTKSCEGSECVAACPKLLQPEKMKNTMYSPAATWRRGELVRLCYSRNNHRGGFARFSLVPVNVMNSRPWHDKLTLFHTCFDGGAVSCAKDRVSCGTDEDTAHCRYIRVPSVFPDGDYVLGHVWYGGLHYKRAHGQFADYYSCSFVKIKGAVGGTKACEAYRPFYQAGFVQPGSYMEKNIMYGMCFTSSTKVGTCGMEGCWDTPSMWGTPDKFKPGAPAVDPITCSLVEEAQHEKSMDERILTGICKEDVCCHKDCGRCGGLNCSKLPGGGENCCTGAIMRNKTRTCDKFDPPCRRV